MRLYKEDGVSPECRRLTKLRSFSVLTPTAAEFNCFSSFKKRIKQLQSFYGSGVPVVKNGRGYAQAAKSQKRLLMDCLALGYTGADDSRFKTLWEPRSIESWDPSNKNVKKGQSSNLSIISRSAVGVVGGEQNDRPSLDRASID